jgi:DNA-dependent protein kinase catalytic subunit
MQEFMVPMWRRIIPALLRLACDVDTVTNQLFSSLVRQIIHWFTNARKV